MWIFLINIGHSPFFNRKSRQFSSKLGLLARPTTTGLSITSSRDIYHSYHNCFISLVIRHTPNIEEENKA